MLSEARDFSEYRCGALKEQERPFVNANAAAYKESDFPAPATRAESAKNLKLIPTSPGLWVFRQRPLSVGAIESRQCKLVELRWLATVSRPDICARLALLASRANSL